MEFTASRSYRNRFSWVLRGFAMVTATRFPAWSKDRPRDKRRYCSSLFGGSCGTVTPCPWRAHTLSTVRTAWSLARPRPASPAASPWCLLACDSLAIESRWGASPDLAPGLSPLPASPSSSSAFYFDDLEQWSHKYISSYYSIRSMTCSQKVDHRAWEQLRVAVACQIIGAVPPPGRHLFRSRQPASLSVHCR